MGLFSPAAPAKVATDTVIPLHFWDDLPVWRSFILYSMFVFDDVLDADKLRSSLEGVINREGWRKLGARLRANAKGGLEYHIPTAFTPDRPALSFSHSNNASKASEHPLGRLIPRPDQLSDEHAAIAGDPDTLQPLLQPPGAPTNLSQYLTSDMPQLGLHIVSFTDATLVTLYWPHTLMDASGKKAVLDAWSLSLQGRIDEVRSPQGWDKDLLADLGKAPKETYGLAGQKMSSLEVGIWALRNIWSFFGSTEHRMVRVPPVFLAKLRKEAESDAAISPADETNKGGGADGQVSEELNVDFVSDGDILTAWWTRVVTYPLRSKPDRQVLLNIPYSLRGPLSSPNDLLAADRGPYVSNAIGGIPVLLTAAQIHHVPLGRLAARIRHAITTLGTRAQVEAFMGLWRGKEGSSRTPLFFGGTGMQMVNVSSWAKARLFETDFRAAVVGFRSDGGMGAEAEIRATPSEPGVGRHNSVQNRPGRPVYTQSRAVGMTMPGAFAVYGKDAGSNYWLSGLLAKGQWKHVEELMTLT